MSFFTRLSLALAALGLACGANRQVAAKGSVRAVVVRHGSQCGSDAENPFARWIGDEGSLRAALGAGGLFGAQEVTPPLDFAKEGVLAVYMGQKRTGGYRLSLHQEDVAIAKGVATVVVRFEEPAAGMMVTQALTSPCLLLRLPREGLREVKVVDPAGAVRASANVRR